jgi:hypothetical protein
VTSRDQRHRASGLNLLVGVIILWNPTYLQRAVDHLQPRASSGIRCVALCRGECKRSTISLKKAGLVYNLL